MKYSFFGENYVGDYYADISNLSWNVISKGNTRIEKKNNRFWLCVLDHFSTRNDISIEYQYVMDGLKQINYIDNSDYERIEKVLGEKIDGSNGDEDLSHLKQYIDEFVLIIAYAKNNCFAGWKAHCDKFQQVLNSKKRKEIRNFFAEMLLTGIDIDKITISCKERENLHLNSPILIKMMIYSFAREYFTFIEGIDPEHWEEQIAYYAIEDKKTGRRKNVGSENTKALINVYLDFMHSIGVFDEKASERDMYLIIGRLLTIAGLEKYDTHKDEHLSYIDEKDYYRSIIGNFLGK